MQKQKMFADNENKYIISALIYLFELYSKLLYGYILQQKCLKK